MNIYEKIIELEKSNQPFVIATVVSTQGSAPGKTGFKMIIDSDTKCTGTVGGGGVEFAVIEEAKKRIVSGESGLKEYLLNGDIVPKKNVEQLRMVCGGSSVIYFEVHGNAPMVYVFGGGHVGHALLFILSKLPFRTVLIDNRKEFANAETNPFADEVICSDYLEFSKNFNPKPNSYCVVLTHGHAFDLDIVCSFYERNFSLKYIGVMASRLKSKLVLDKIKNRCGNKKDVSNFYSPIGLKLGGDTAGEIALGIAAQMLDVHYKGTNRK
ncbi:MAG: XdhC/CoxI family protein [Ignavibacteriaceae bacterium]|nr:XdhC/CoxI family protein [Ignavibacteriaceae bacterium]